MSPNIAIDMVEMAKTGIVATIWAALLDYSSKLPPDSTFQLLALPLLTIPVLNLITSLWGAYLLYSVLYFSTGNTAFRDLAPFWLLFLPGFFGWFFLVLALDVTFPFIDPGVNPLFFAGVSIMFGYYFFPLTTRRFFDYLRRISTRALGRVMRKVRGPRALSDTNYGL